MESFLHLCKNDCNFETALNELNGDDEALGRFILEHVEDVYLSFRDCDGNCFVVSISDARINAEDVGYAARLEHSYLLDD